MTDPIVPAASQAPAARVGRGITIAGVVFAFLFPVLGLVLSIVGLVQARGAGQKNGLAIAGIIISIVWPIIIGIIIAVATTAGLASACAGLEPGVYDNNGVTLTCG
jgi:hypothetical protein